MKRLLLTGARGFIGQCALRPALEAGFEVHAIRSTTGGREPDATLPVTWHTANLLGAGVADDLVERIKPSHILQTAWVTDHGAYWTSPANLDWLAFGARLAKAFAAHGGQRFVSVGTCAEYDWTGTGPLVEDTSPEEPETFYGKIKLCHHQMLMAASQQLGFTAATGRIFFIYGPHEGPRRLIAYACRELAAGRRASFSSGQQRRDFLHVEDAARGLVALLDSSISGACNVSSGSADSLRDVVSHIAGISGCSDLVSFDAARDRPGDPPLILGDATRLHSTGWVPLIPLQVGLSRTYAWWKTVGGSCA
ncbi:NAD(P)-dependent oxidoreductase [Bradyrhizobium septentrionale]|uniref:NAD(P)-dependent oxidoreductase n=1 Tax=Bradyrhizobium septentrionale TaxID=1404411 RepID=A0ABZ2NS83_9BRAD